MRVYLVRHGQTEWSRSGRFCGTSDPPLNAHGMVQARALARRLAGTPVGRIFASPRARATQTAEILAQGLEAPVEILPLLGETDFGAWEGLTRDEIAARFPDAWRAWQARPDLVAPPGGESGPRTWLRGRRALQQIWPGDERTSVVVAHRTLNRVVLSRLLGLPLRHFRRLGQDEVCLNILDLTAPLRLSALVCLNDTCHLRGEHPP